MQSCSAGSSRRVWRAVSTRPRPRPRPAGPCVSMATVSRGAYVAGVHSFTAAGGGRGDVCDERVGKRGMQMRRAARSALHIHGPSTGHPSGCPLRRRLLCMYALRELVWSGASALPGVCSDLARASVCVRLFACGFFACRQPRLHAPVDDDAPDAAASWNRPCGFGAACPSLSFPSAAPLSISSSPPPDAGTSAGAG